MNISSNYSNKPAFGMAFKKPNQQVMDYFENVIYKMAPSERQNFVNEMNEIVQSAKSCPVPIEHALWKREGDSTIRYMSMIDGKSIYGTYNNKNPQTEIICAMNNAVKEARNIHNANENVNQIKKIFDIRV